MLKLDTTETSTKNPRTLAAGNIRKELKHKFPGQKFSVTSSRGSIRISWIDSVTTKQVHQIADKYKHGHFNSMADIYEYDKDFNDSFGYVDYIFTDRDYSHAAYTETLQEVTIYENEEYITCRDNKDNNDITGLYSNDYHTNNRLRTYLSERNFALSLEDQKKLNEEEEIKKEEEYQAFKIAEDIRMKQAQEDHKIRMEEINPIYSGDGTCPKLNSFITLKYAKLNKNNTLGEYLEEVKNGDYNATNSKIEKIVMLSNKKFDDFTQNLMDGHDFLSPGGTNSDDERLKNTPEEFWKWTEEQITIFRNTSYNLVTAIVAPNRKTFFVDAQGYKYARYVAVA